MALAILLWASAVLSAQSLWEAWPKQRFVTTAAPCLRHAELVERLQALEAKHRGRLALEEVGRSAEGRSLHLLTVGRGPRKILLWSQMHGDEPSATPALLDLADFLLSRPNDAAARTILERMTLLMVPMLNPDGAERYRRRNAQGIDVNRDALNLATPEGRLLKELRDRHAPELGFNLHDQNRRTTVGGTGQLATIALLAVAGDPQGTLTPGRLRARRVCAAIVAALEGLVPGRIARYDEDWSPRAFGDNLTAWGTPVVLIESGGLPPEEDLTDLTRLNFVALLSALGALARDDALSHDPAVYDSLRRSQAGAYADVLLQGGHVLQQGALAPVRADLAFNILTTDLVMAGCLPGPVGRSTIVEVGDARLIAAGRRLEAARAVLAPGFAASVHGIAAREWLTPEALVELARLGVVALRWHVSDGERSAAEAVARERAGERRPAIQVVAAEAPGLWLRLEGRPSPARSRSLAHALDALAGEPWRARAAGRPFTAVLGLLAGLPETPTARTPVMLVPEAPASFLFLRSAQGRPLDPDTTRLDGVWIDGREVPIEP